MKLIVKSILFLFLLGTSYLSFGSINIDSLKQKAQSNDLFEKANSQLELAIQLISTDSIASRNYILSFNKLNLKSLNDSNYNKLVLRKNDFYRSTFKFREAVTFLGEAIKRAASKNDFTSKALFHQLITPHYFSLFNYDSCDYHLDEAINIYSHQKDTSKLGLLTIRKSGIQYVVGNYEKAIEFAFEATELFKKAKDESQLSIAYLQLGNIFYFLKDYEEANQYYELSAEIFKRHENIMGYYQAISNLALVMVMQEKFRESIPIQMEASKHFKESRRELELGNSYRYLSAAYEGLSILDSTEYFNELSIISSKKTSYTVGLGQGLLMRAKIESRNNNYKEALKHALRAYKIVDSVQHYESIKLVTEELSTIYEKLGNINKSYKYLKEHIALADSLDVDPNTLKDYAILHQFKVEEAQFKLKLSQEREKMQNELNKKQKSQLIVAILVAVASLVFLFLTIIILVRNKKLTKELAEKQKLIKEELIIKESLLSEIHHRVKNNLQVISSMLSLQTQYITDKELKKIINDCKGRISSMSLIHESLYKKLDGEAALFSTYIKNLIPRLIDTYQVDENKIKLKMDLEPIHLTLDESIPSGLIINEVVSNSLKHAFVEGDGGTICISLKKLNDIVELKISDNGVGLSFDLNFEDQESFGFLLIDTLAKQLEAKLVIDSDDKMEYIITWESQS